MNRYARQSLIQNWDQHRLEDAHITIVGTGWLARWIALLTTAMGFGHIHLVGAGRIQETDRKSFLCYEPEGASIVRTWAKALQQINPEVEIGFLHGEIEPNYLERLPKTQVVIAATGDTHTLVQSYRYAKSIDAHFMASSVGPQIGLYRVDGHLSKDFLVFQGVEENPLVSLVTATLVTEEIRRVVMSLGAWDVPAEGPVLVSPDALHQKAGGKLVSGKRAKSKVVLVGAGALGTWAGMALGSVCDSSVVLDIYDPDGVEKHNLNRQVLFHDAIHQDKAQVLAQKLTEQFPHIHATGFVERIETHNVSALSKYDAILCGPDNFETRAILNREAVASHIPLVNGGTSAFGAEVATYVPGHASCLECALRVETLSKTVAFDEARARCQYVAEPSVVTSNALAGALMAHQLMLALQQDPARGVIVYDAKVSGRKLGVRSVQTACSCATKQMKTIAS